MLQAARLEHAGRSDVQARLAGLLDMLGSQVGARTGEVDHLREHRDPRAEVSGLLGDLRGVRAAPQVVGHVAGLGDHAGGSVQMVGQLAGERPHVGAPGLQPAHVLGRSLEVELATLEEAGLRGVDLGVVEHPHRGAHGVVEVLHGAACAADRLLGGDDGAAGVQGDALCGQ